jgi:hypothetical protein
MTSLSERTPASTRHPLADEMVALAETPDDVPGVEEHLRRIAQLAAGRIATVDYAAVVPRPGAGGSVVAVSGELIEDVAGAGGTGDSAGAGAATTMAWPHFRETAVEMGLGAVSVPLFVGSGAEIAALDLYSRDQVVVAALLTGVCAAYHPEVRWPSGDLRALDAGGEELLAGFTGALAARAAIQLALTMIGAEGDTGKAYLQLRLQAATDQVSLPDAANSVIARSLGA